SALGQRKVRIERERQLEFGERIVKPTPEQMHATERVVRPRILAVSEDRRLRCAVGEGRRHRRIRPTHMCAEDLTGGEQAERLPIRRSVAGPLLQRCWRPAVALPCPPPVMRQRRITRSQASRLSGGLWRARKLSAA